MIFVTVGTHEQPFDRLIKYMDEWAGNHKEKVIIQTGYCTYEPINCEWSKLYPYQTMVELVNNARIIITHGGPSSFLMPLQIGKVPIVVPRRKKYNEHVNNHQVEFSKAVAKRQGNIIVVENEEKLDYIIDFYDKIVNKMKVNIVSNNEKFCVIFEKIIKEILNI